ncbi:MAG: DUF1987 domain-containing protein [Flavobacteriales bacterium]|nr:DUF1987 domain-containing protein [Flavobacteriales bacterium]
MKEVLEVDPSSTTPKVYFDLLKEEFRISGRSMPEDSEGFYQPLREWMRTHLTGTKLKGNFDLQLEYYNTGSFIRLMEIFNLLAELNKGGCQFTVRWFYESDDLDSRDDGESFKDVVKVPFDIFEI